MRKIGKALNSPIINTRQDVISLWHHLCKMRERKRADWSKEVAHKVVYPKQAYDEKQIRYCMHFLLSAIRTYLTYEELKQSPNLEAILLTKAYRKRGLDQVFLKASQKAIDELSSMPHRSADYHHSIYQLHFERYQLTNRKQRAQQENLSQLTDSFTYYTIIQTLQLACMLLAHKNINPATFGHLPLITEVLKLAQATQYQDVPAINLYYQIYHTLLNETNDADFNQLKALLFDSKSLFPPSEIRALYLLVINYCIKQLNSGKRNFIKEAFELYKAGLENKILLDNGVLSTYTYSNVLQLGVALKQYDWVEAFLDTYKKYLPLSERENTYLYNLTVFYFRKPDYDKAIGLLQQVEFHDVFYNLDARRMLLQIYYETDAIDALESLLDSFSIYLRRHQKEIGYHYHNYANLLKMVRQIMRSNLTDKSTRQQLKEKVQSIEVVAERDWLLQQLE
jgi:hypothetical protein